MSDRTVKQQESIEDPSNIQRVRTLVLRHGWNTTAYQILNPGISHWFSAADDAVIGFVQHCGVRIVAGAPVCAKESLIDVVAEFEQAAATANCRVCYFCAESRLGTALQNSAQHSIVLLGAQPSWRPLQWPAIFPRHASLRAQLKRAGNKAVRVSEWPVERASREPALLGCLREWLATRSFPTLHFLVEPMTLERLYDRRVFVAEREGEVIGFVVASPVPHRKGWLIEQIIRGKNAVNGTSEMMIDAAVRSMAESGSEFMTLGLSPLSHRTAVQSAANPLWVRLLLGRVRAHGCRFYNFNGLDTFKAKFQPERWEPIFAISNEARFSPLVLYAIASAFTQGSPVRALNHAILKALQTEIDWFTEKPRRH